MRVVMTPDFSDANPYQRELVERLADRGVDVTMGDTGGLWGLQVLPLLAAARSAGHPDVLHLHWVHAFVTDERRWLSALLGLQLVVELALLRLAGTRVVWTVHNLLDHERRLPRSVELGLRHAVFRVAHRVVVHCDDAADAVVETYRLPDAARSAVTTIPHGHYRESYPNELSRATARSALGYGDETVFCYFGRIRRYKNVAGLVEAFRRLDAPDIRLLVVGSPRYAALEDELAGLAADDSRIRTVLEFVPEADIQRYLNAADAVVLPFDDVLSSGSAMLAMSFDRAVIAPAVGCVGTLVPDELLYDPDAPGALEGALDDARSADLEALGERCGRVAAANDWATFAERTHSVYGSAPAAG